jgi:3-hydroxyethyl bacteriochlorophyllide a dehydrogenase
MDTFAVVLDRPESLSLSRLSLTAPGDGDVVVDVAWSGISTGTERLLYLGRMPPFPGLGYPLVPGYETVGRIVDAGRSNGTRAGEMVFVPGANCFGDVRGLFGGAASRLVVPAARALRIDPGLRERGVLLALAATAWHVLVPPGRAPFSEPPNLIVGHGVLGRLLARLVVQSGAPPPVVWESNPERMAGAAGYQVATPDADRSRRYDRICDASGDPALLDSLIARLAPGGEIVLAGFYPERLSFAFPPAFLCEARLRVAAEFRPHDLESVRQLIEDGRLSLDGLITHRSAAACAPAAYQTAFGDPACLKMILDWSAIA